MKTYFSEMAGHNRPNPMYIFTSIEAQLLRSIYVPDQYRRKNSLALVTVPFVAAWTDPDDVRDYIIDKAGDADKVIITGVFASTLKTPHHIHENGDMEETPGREGPIRTYFDGSSLTQLGHAVAIHIDRPERKITTQCPKGYDLEPFAAKLLDTIFAGYAHETVRQKQQTDQHSCLPITLRNIFAHAGVMPPANAFDIGAWRSELLDELHRLQIYAQKSGIDTLQCTFQANDDALAGRRIGSKVPIYARKYMPGTL